MPTRKLQCETANASPCVDGAVAVYIEQVGDDTLLNKAGLPLLPGDFYYGIHLKPIAPNTSIAKEVAKGMAALACVAVQHHRGWKRDEYGDSPLWVAGVTYSEIGRAARLLGFKPTLIDPQISKEPANDAAGWGGNVERVAARHASYTAQRKEENRQPFRLAVVSMSVADLVKTWHPLLADEQHAGYADLRPDDMVFLSHRDAEVPANASHGDA